LGVALLIPPHHDREIDGLRRALGDPALDRILPHLTLVPPVNVREDELGDAARVLREAGAATRPFAVEIGPAATFLPENPVLYLAVAGGGVDAVRTLRERVFQPPLERKLTHDFVPHVTIADEADRERIEAGLVALRDYRIEVTFERVHLLQEREGRKWEAIGDFPFAAPAVIGRGGLELELTVSKRHDPDATAFQAREWPAADLAVFGTTSMADPIAIAARRDGEIVGLASGYVSTSHGHLEELIVAADARHEGVGSKLLAAFESKAVELGATFLTLDTADAGPAENFYAAHGWRRDHVLPKFHFDRDFVRMVRAVG
jgi:2'-5' RNA ligase